jgi:hypothetical protein
MLPLDCLLPAYFASSDQEVYFTCLNYKHAYCSGHTHVAEALKVPIHIFFTMPWT